MLTKEKKKDLFFTYCISARYQGNIFSVIWSIKMTKVTKTKHANQ